MSQEQYDDALEQFKSDYAYLFTTTFGKDDEDTVRLLAIRKIRFDGMTRRTTNIEEYQVGLEAVGEALRLRLHLTAIKGGRELITQDWLAGFLYGYLNHRTFVQTDSYGNRFAVVA